MNTNQWFVSSTGSGLSATIGGVSIVGIAQIVSMAAASIGHPVDQSSISALIVSVITAVGAVYAAFGLARKLYYAFVTKTPA